MSHLYPSLEDKFRNEGVCPICMQEMELTPKFSCVNNHMLCHRCKPYYYSCPKCHSPLNIEIAPPEVNPLNPPPPVHFMPHPMSRVNAPYPTQMPIPMPMPTAPTSDDFHAHERHAMYPASPGEDQQLIPCSYSHFGCWVKFPKHLREVHESRCHFQNSDSNHSDDEENCGDCKYKEAGCNARIPAWKRVSHEDDCPYKGRFEEMENLRSSVASVSIDRDSSSDESYHDPDEIVDCRFQKYGCMVRMPYRRKRVHESKCNYRQEDDEDSEEDYVDPDELVDCKWSKYGCKVRPKYCRREMHEEKCNYKKDSTHQSTHSTTYYYA